MQTIQRGVSAAVIFSCLAVAAHAAEAKKKAPAQEKAKETADEAAPAGEEAQPKSKYKIVPGPGNVDLGNDLSIALRDGDLFLDKQNAKLFMTNAGNQPGDNLLGLVTKGDATWIVEISFDPEGYVKDDEAEKLDADEILKVIREGTEEANKYREEHGFAAVRVDGWSEPPRYDKKLHQVVWGIKGSSAKQQEPGQPPPDPAAGRDQVINFNTRILGRKGYASLNLIDDAATLEASKPQVSALLAATTFKPGSRYEDFDSKNDKVAEYGLAALVAGGAGAAALKLAKIGLLAKFGGKLLALLIAGKKALVLALIGLGALIKKALGIRKKSDESSASSAPPPPSEPPSAPPAPGV